jgi:hypothetical protein
MILFKIFKLLIPLVVLNWVLSEADLVVPGMRDKVLSIFDVVQIPTHDKWPEDIKNLDFSDIGQDVQDALANYKNAHITRASSRPVYSYSGKIDVTALGKSKAKIFDKDDLFTSLKDHKPLVDNLR